MLIQQKIGHIGSIEVRERLIDVFELEWHETGKRIMRKQTRTGREVAMRFLREGPALMEGDVLYADEIMVIVVEIIPCEVIVVRMEAVQTVAAVCYEIGNRHLPLFYEGAELLMPFDAPLYRWLKTGGFEAGLDRRKLLFPLRSTVAGHVHASGGLLSKILGS